MSNYPDDWWAWDRNDPRSPIYLDPDDWCEHCEQKINEDGICGCEELDFD